MYLSVFFQKNTITKSYILHIKQTQKTKSWREEADCVRTLGCKEQHDHKFLGFFCQFVCFIYPRLGTAEAGNLEMPMGRDKRNPNRNLLSSLTKRSRKSQNCKTENIQTINLSTPAKYHRKKMAPTHSCQQKSSTEPRLLHLCGYSVMSQYSCQGNIRHVHPHWPMLCLYPTAWLLVESTWRAWTSTHRHQ